MRDIGSSIDANIGPEATGLARQTLADWNMIANLCIALSAGARSQPRDFGTRQSARPFEHRPNPLMSIFETPATKPDPLLDRVLEPFVAIATSWSLLDMDGTITQERFVIELAKKSDGMDQPRSELLETCAGPSHP